MKVALISDIHANLIALDAVLADIAREKADRIICLGDVAFKGPQPHEVIERLKSIECTFVMGNTDRIILDPELESKVQELPEMQRMVGDLWLWGASQLTPSDRDFMGTFFPLARVALDNGETLLCFHGSPRSAEERIFPSTSEEELSAALSNHTANIFAGGHTHQQILRRWNDSLFINPGTVGLPQTPPEAEKATAEYALVTIESRASSVEFRKVPFDRGELIKIAREKKMPQIKWWLETWQASR
ncbi:MAG: metallophosphoesterase family protein [Firmicutes bacterium]|nr:metallophosphoesterase family protein [Bacillota bacterium]